VVKDTPRQDVLPPLTTGLISATPGAGTLFPQPRLASGALMDELHGRGWRLVSDGTLAFDAPAGLTPIDLGRTPEAEGVVAAWLARHGAHAALVRPDHYCYGSAADAAGLAQLLSQWQQR